MAMSVAQRASVAENTGIPAQIVEYIILHSVSPGSYALTYAAMRKHFGWADNDPINGSTMANFAVAVKAGVDAVQP